MHRFGGLCKNPHIEKAEGFERAVQQVFPKEEELQRKVTRKAMIDAYMHRVAQGASTAEEQKELDEMYTMLMQDAPVLSDMLLLDTGADLPDA